MKYTYFSVNQIWHYRDGLMAEGLDSGVGNFVITFVRVGTFSLSDFATFDVLFDEFCDL